MEFTRTEFFAYLLIGQIVLGILLGLIPFFLGRKRGNTKLGNIGLIVSILVGLLSPLAAIVAVAVFSWLIVRKKETLVETPSHDESPVENS